MDCESFERIVLDRVFLELDELTMGSAQRHVAHCSRCRSIEVALRATRDVCKLPTLLPMEGFSESVLAHEKQLHAVLPVRQRLNRAVSMLASYAMKPQPTMAVLLLLMIGASLFLVRSHPANRDLVQVTERGVPELEQEPAANKEASSPNAQASLTGDGAPEQGEQRVASNDLEHARTIRKNLGCSAAIQPLETIRQKYPASDTGLAATWEAAECYVIMDRKSDARELYEALIASPKYAKRAKAQLLSMGINDQPKE